MALSKEVDIQNYFSIEKIEEYFDRLYPICRSILGEGFRDSIDILTELIPLKLEKFPSGTNVLDWTVPDEWNIQDAYIITPSGAKIADFKKHNLHVVNYSIPVDTEMTLDELRPHLYTLPNMPDHFPYVASYYERRWGFCISQNQYDSLEQGTYKVVIKSEIKPGNLVYGQCIIPGNTDKEIFLSTYLCHPQMANHELSGPLAMAWIYKVLKDTGPHKYTYRFLICPENIGAAAFLAKDGLALKNNIQAGYIINCVGHGEKFTYKKSRRGDSLADYAAINTLSSNDYELEIVDFFPDGSDERQYCSPGFNLPIGLIMREMYGQFPEYHTSADNKDFISFETIQSTVKVYLDTILALEKNFTPIAKILYGSPMLSKSSIPLYRDIMDFAVHEKEESLRILLEILNCSDGSLSLLEIANLKGFRLVDHLKLIDNVVLSGYISEYSK